MINVDKDRQGWRTFGLAYKEWSMFLRRRSCDDGVDPPNVLTLSCKHRLTCLPREAARRLPRLTRSGGSELQPTCRARAVRAARGGSPPGHRTGGVFSPLGGGWPV